MLIAHPSCVGPVPCALPAYLVSPTPPSPAPAGSLLLAHVFKFAPSFGTTVRECRLMNHPNRAQTPNHPRIANPNSPQTKPQTKPPNTPTTRNHPEHEAPNLPRPRRLLVLGPRLPGLQRRRLRHLRRRRRREGGGPQDLDSPGGPRGVASVFFSVGPRNSAIFIGLVGNPKNTPNGKTQFSLPEWICPKSSQTFGLPPKWSNPRRTPTLWTNPRSRLSRLAAVRGGAGQSLVGHEDHGQHRGDHRDLAFREVA